MYMGNEDSQTRTHTGALCASYGTLESQDQKRSLDSHIISSPWQELGCEATGEPSLGQLSGAYPVHYHAASYTFILRGHISFLEVLPTSLHPQEGPFTLLAPKLWRTLMLHSGINSMAPATDIKSNNHKYYPSIIQL